MPKDQTPYAIALSEAIEKYGKETAHTADRLCWGSNKAADDPSLLRISREMYDRMAQLADVETQSERTARTIEAQRAAQERKKARRKVKRLEEDADDEDLAA